jgi:hypothetical protein
MYINILMKKDFQGIMVKEIHQSGLYTSCRAQILRFDFKSIPFDIL